MNTSINQSVSSFIIAASNQQNHRISVRTITKQLLTGDTWLSNRIFAKREKSLWRKLNLINLL